jgi:hypothetical protein
MISLTKTNWVHLLKIYSGPKPGDFPIGSPQSRAAARAMVARDAEQQRDMEEDLLANLTPVEQAMIEVVESRGVRILMIRLIRAAQERAKLYGNPFPSLTPEEIRHNRAVYKEIDRMTGGEASSLEMSDSIKWNRLKVVAEENLRAKKI